MSPPRHNRRHGLTTLMAVIALTMLMAAGVLSYSVFATRDSYIELRYASHAGSLAGAGALAHDDLLTNDTSRVLNRLSIARDSAVQVTEANQLKSLFLSMNPPNPSNDPTGNLVFGTLDRELGGTFMPLFPLPAAVDLFPYDSARLNAVRIDVTHPKRPGVHVRMYAHLDHNIVGFKPTNAINAPVVPIALFSGSILTPRTLEAATAVATDLNQFNYGTQTFPLIPGGPDGIPEVRFEYGNPSADPTVVEPVNLRIGTTTFADFQAQVASGLTVADVAFFSGQFAPAGGGSTLNVPPFLPPPDIADFAAAFLPVSTPNAAIPRVFPLFSGFDPTTGDALVSGFVAARVVSVATDTMNGRVTVTIQPTLVSSPLAVTPAGCPSPAPIFVRTIAKVRIAATVTEAP